MIRIVLCTFIFHFKYFALKKKSKDLLFVGLLITRCSLLLFFRRKQQKLQCCAALLIHNAYDFMTIWPFVHNMYVRNWLALFADASVFVLQSNLEFDPCGALNIEYRAKIVVGVWFHMHCLIESSNAVHASGSNVMDDPGTRHNVTKPN